LKSLNDPQRLHGLGAARHLGALQAVVEPDRRHDRHRQPGRSVLDEGAEPLREARGDQGGDVIGRADHLAAVIRGETYGQDPVAVRGSKRPIRPAGVGRAHLDAVEALVAELDRLHDDRRCRRVTQDWSRMRARCPDDMEPPAAVKDVAPHRNP
jgi:hypothetical protein